VLNLRSDLLRRGDGHLPGAGPTPRRGVKRKGTKCLLRSHDEIPDTLQPLLTRPVMSTATRHPRRRRRRRDCLRGGCTQKNVRGYTRYFYHSRGKNCLDTQEPALSLTKRNTGALLVNNVAFTIVIYDSRFTEQTD